MARSETVEVSAVEWSQLTDADAASIALSVLPTVPGAACALRFETSQPDAELLDGHPFQGSAMVGIDLSLLRPRVWARSIIGRPVQVFVTTIDAA